MAESLLLNFDLEEFVAREFGVDVSKKEVYDTGRNGLIRLIKVLKEFPESKCTFFTTFTFSDYCGKEINQLIDMGHEIGLHGYTHEQDYRKMNIEEIKKSLAIAKKGIEKSFGIKITGFRAQQMRMIPYNILRDLGIKYDSSLHPTYVPGYYNAMFKSRKMFKKDDVFVIPVTVTPLFRLPFSWIWFRNVGLTYAKFCTKVAGMDSDYINIYFHPWEFVDIDKKIYREKMMGLIMRNTGEKMAGMMKNYIQWSLDSGLKMRTIGEYLENEG